MSGRLRHTRKHTLTNGREGTRLAPNAEIVGTVDGEYMVLVNGFQIGGDVGRSGAGNATFSTLGEARAFWETWR